jgi:hypothetical protein
MDDCGKLLLHQNLHLFGVFLASLFFYFKDDYLTKKASQERLLISKLTREDLEDKYLKQYDENILLKKHARKQEDRIKKYVKHEITLISILKLK